MPVLHIPAETETGRSVWPEKFPKSELNRRKKVLGDLRYAQEYLVQPISLFGSKLQLDWISYYDGLDLERGVLGNIDYYFGVDPSVSGTGDYMAICVLGKPSTGSTMYLVDFIREKANLDRALELLERTARIYPPRIVNVEAVAAQHLLVQNIMSRTPLPARSYYPKGKKQDKIAVMAQVFFASKKCLVRGIKTDVGVIPDPRMTDFLREWVAFDRGRNDDTLDAADAALECAGFAGTAYSVSVEEEGPTMEEWPELRRRNLWQ